MRTTLLALILALSACASPPADGPEPASAPGIGAGIDAPEYLDVPTTIERAEDLPIGAFLGEVGSRVQAWTTARVYGDKERERILGQVLEFECAKRQRELIEQLQTGPVRNRKLAAVALGFTNRLNVLQPDNTTRAIDKGAEALGPLLGAIGDPDAEVSANALMGLGILARPETPLGPVCAALDGSEEPWRRGNAAFALSAVLEAAHGHEDGIGEDRTSLARDASLRNLDDSDLSVRAQCAASLGLVGDADSLAHLADYLDDEVTLVGQAAGRAMVRLAREDPTLKGRVARLLSHRLDLVRPSRRDVVLTALVLLAERHLGNDAEVWKDWAQNLPSS